LISDYHYRVAWSADDALYVASVIEFPSLATHGDSPEAALQAMYTLLQDVLADLQDTEP